MRREDLLALIQTRFQTAGEALWAAYPNYLVFRNARNKKWFGVLMDIERGKLHLPEDGKTDILVLKSDPLLIGSLLENDWCLPAYHMNKNHWITVLIERASEEEIEMLLGFAYGLIDRKK